MFAIVSEHASMRMSLCTRLNDFTDTEVTTRAAETHSLITITHVPNVLSRIFYSFFPQCKLPNVLLAPVPFLHTQTSTARELKASHEPEYSRKKRFVLRTSERPSLQNPHHNAGSRGQRQQSGICMYKKEELLAALLSNRLLKRRGWMHYNVQ